jgi:BMFP domain-containing protein YqiC
MKATAIKNNIKTEIDKSIQAVSWDTTVVQDKIRILFDDKFEKLGITNRECLDILDDISTELDRVKMLIRLVG